MDAHTSVVTRTGTPQSLLESATEHRAQQRFDEAETLYRSVLEQQPNHLTALLGLGLCARQRGDDTAALTWFRNAASAHPDHPQPVLEIAAQHRAQQQLDEAETLYRSVLEQQPNHLTALLGLGLCARQRGDDTAALTWFRNAASAHPDHPQPVLEIAAQHRTQQQLDEAETLYRSVLEQQPNHLTALLGLGLCARQRGDDAAALTWFRNAASAHPDHPQPVLEIAAQHRTQQQLDEAETLYRSVLEQQPNHLTALLGLGLCARQRGDHAAALGWCQAAVAAYPNHPEPLVEIATAELELGRPESSRKAVEHALALNPYHISACLFLARLERLCDSFDRSLDLLETAYSRNTANIQVLIALTNHWMEAGYPENAIQLLNSYTNNFGKNITVELKNVEILRMIGQINKAIFIANSILNKVPWNFNAKVAYFHLLWILHGKDVAYDFLYCINGNTVQENITLYCLHALLHEYNGNMKSAKQCYEQALSIIPNHPGVINNLLRINIISLDDECAKKYLNRSVNILFGVNILQGKSTNSSQNFFGQLLDEIVIERDGLSRLKSFRDFEVSKRIPKIFEFVRDYPDYTAGAMQFLLTVTQDGWVDRWPCGGSRIPKTIIQYWDNPDIPDYLTAINETWTIHNPLYQHLIFNDYTAREFIQKYYPRNVISAYLRAPEPTQKADIFRLAYLFIEGGYYVDMDDRCLCSLDEFLPNTADFIGWKENIGTIGNNFMAAPPRSPIISRALQDAVASVNRGDSDILWLSTGPGAVSRAFVRVIAESQLTWSEWMSRIFLMSPQFLSRGISIHSIVPYKKTEKHWLSGAFGRSGVGQAAEKR